MARFMGSSRTITLFSNRPEPAQRPFPLAASVLLHLVVFGPISYVVAHQPQIWQRTEHYTVRRIEFHEDPAKDSQIPYPGPLPAAATPKSANLAPGDRTGAGGQPAPALAAQLAQLQISRLSTGPQTLVQPKTPFHLKTSEEIPVPQAMIWTPEKEPAQTIVPPAPQPPTAAHAEPSIEPPNDEINLSDLGIASSDLSSQSSPVTAGTTSPLKLEDPKAAQLPPVLTSNSGHQPTPAAVLSLSDTRMPNGTANLPPVNETARSNASAGLGTHPAGAADGSGSATDSRRKGEASASQPSTQAQAKQPPHGTVPANSSPAGTVAEQEMTAARVVLPKNGRFGVVVVGASSEDRYPEIARLWSGRLAYTVYLHIGAAKSWILQYTLPPSAEAAAGGNIARIEGPWPYNIVRPDIPPEMINADALMVHGYVNQEGRFEGLAVVFPPDFEPRQFLLDSLSQWQFRPATQNGEKIRVEVLLIIPEQEQ